MRSDPVYASLKTRICPRIEIVTDLMEILDRNVQQTFIMY